MSTIQRAQTCVDQGGRGRGPACRLFAQALHFRTVDVQSRPHVANQIEKDGAAGHWERPGRREVSRMLAAYGSAEAELRAA